MTDVSARLAVHANAPLRSKDYVLKLRFSGLDSNREVAEELDLHFSDGLGALYLYNPEQKEGQTGHTKFFHLPHGVDGLTVEIERWLKREGLGEIIRVDLQFLAPWSALNRVTQIGIATNGS